MYVGEPPRLHGSLRPVCSFLDVRGAREARPVHVGEITFQLHDFGALQPFVFDAVHRVKVHSLGRGPVGGKWQADEYGEQGGGDPGAADFHRSQSHQARTLAAGVAQVNRVWSALGPRRIIVKSMAIFRPFRAMQPRHTEAARIAAVPYDVVSVDEARTQAAENPLSFLRVSRPELELANGADPHGAEVYERAVQNFERLKARALVLDDEPSAYFYRLRHGTHEQIGLAGCFSIDEYERDVIKKHERTRRDKEDDRTR